MYPNLFLRTFWSMDLWRKIFVAMSFADVYKRRYDEVIAPAIRQIKVDGVELEPYRVDLSKTGDSILSDIIDGIAHCALFLADVSTVGTDKTTGTPYRNGNVMYEVGLALASRQPTEILLVRDDQDRFLFDVSTIPHKRIDFTDVVAAREELREELETRLAERNFVRDARMELAVSSLCQEELHALKLFGKKARREEFGLKPGVYKHGTATGLALASDKRIIKWSGRTKTGLRPMWTDLGYVLVVLT